MDSNQTVTSPQSLIENNKQNNQFKVNVVLILTLLLTVMLVGASIFFFNQLKNIQSSNENLKKEVLELANSNKELISKNIELENSTKDIISRNTELLANTQKLENTKTVSCLDSDGGKDYYVNGQIKFEERDKKGSLTATSDPSDDCVDRVISGVTKKVLREYYCDANNQVQYDYFTCPQGCNKGVCIGSSPNNSR